MTDDSQDLDALDPALEAALARDGVPMVQLARLAGLDYRTIRRWSDGHQLVADFIAGRARLVAVEGGAPGDEPRRGWVLERLADRGIPPVEVARAADAVEAWLSQAPLGVWRALSTGTSGGTDAPEYLHNKRNTVDLQAVEVGSSPSRMLSTTAIQSVAKEVDGVSDGAMVTVAFRAPKAFMDRIRAAARMHGMNPSTYMRSVAWMFSEPPKGG